MSKSVLIGAAKSALALTTLALIGVVVDSLAAPSVTPTTVLLHMLAGLALISVAVVALAVLSLTFRQFILRLGGTDAQWFWFSSEPRGLQRLRRAGRASAHQRMP